MTKNANDETQHTTPIGMARYAGEFHEAAIAADDILGKKSGYEIIGVRWVQCRLSDTSPAFGVRWGQCRLSDTSPALAAVTLLLGYVAAYKARCALAPPARHRSRGGKWAIRSGTREYARGLRIPPVGRAGGLLLSATK
jgi:hypothetical protein